MTQLFLAFLSTLRRGGELARKGQVVVEVERVGRNATHGEDR